MIAPEIFRSLWRWRNKTYGPFSILYGGKRIGNGRWQSDVGIRLDGNSKYVGPLVVCDSQANSLSSIQYKLANCFRVAENCVGGFKFTLDFIGLKRALREARAIDALTFRI